jgi:hypothetical protein
MTVSPERMKIIDKVMKLLAMAEGSTFSDERATASRMAAEMMAKHQVEMGEIKQEDFVIDQIDSGRKIKDKIETSLINTVSRFCGTKVYSTGSTAWRPGRSLNATWIVVGKPQDIEATKYMFDMIKNQMDAALNLHRKARGLKYTQMTLGMKNEFRRGFVYGAQNKIYELINMQNNQMKEWGLVVVSGTDLAANWYEASNKTSKGRGMSGNYSTAGYQAGNNVSINKGVTAGGRLQIGH